MKKLSLLFLLSTSFCSADTYFTDLFFSNALKTPNQFYISPLLGRASYKTGAVEQKGYVYGVEANYDFINQNVPYLGAETHYSKVKLKAGDLHSNYSEYALEAKVGFSLASNEFSSFTPYAGLGYENQRNSYEKSNMVNNKFQYFSLGFLSNYVINPQMSVGLNVKAKMPYTGEQKLQKDLIKSSPKICKKYHYAVELPVTYLASSNSSLAVSPFYQHKQGNCNAATAEPTKSSKLKVWGINIKCNFYF